MASLSALVSVTDFLKNYPPFSFIAQDDLLKLAKSCKLEFFAPKEIVFEENHLPNNCFYIVKKGKITLSQKVDENSSVLVDECGTGDILGVRAIFADQMYISTATAEEESLVFVIPIDPMNLLLEKYPKVSIYFASIFAMGIAQNKDANEEGEEDRKTRKFLVQKEDWLQTTSNIDTIQVQAQKKIITASPTQTIQEVAQTMATFRIGSIIVVDAKNYPIGIITDTDLRTKVVAKALSVQEPVSTIMSNPVLTMPSGLSVLEVMLLMSAKVVSHICITADGTPMSEVLGMVSQRDILLLQGKSPSILVKQIRKSNDSKEIAALRDQAENLVHSYLFQELAIPLISNIITQINDALIEKAMEMALEHLEKEGIKKSTVKFCWLSLGSEGRKEQFLRTDQDNAFVYEDIEDENEAQEAKNYFLKLNEYIADFLVACGFVRCPADMMASNPKWCQPLSQWKNYFNQWINTPDSQALMYTTIFFDFRPIYGDFELAEQLKNYIFGKIDKQPKFLSLLAKNALQNLPPLSFFNNMIVEKNGEHKDLFDIKARSMMPLADVARVFMLEFRLKSYGSTFERFEQVGKLDKGLKDICYSSALAYEIFIKHRAISGFKNKDSGRYIDPKDFNKLEKQILKTAFETISKLQKIVEVRYQLNYIR